MRVCYSYWRGNTHTHSLSLCLYRQVRSSFNLSQLGHVTSVSVAGSTTLSRSGRFVKQTNNTNVHSISQRSVQEIPMTTTLLPLNTSSDTYCYLVITYNHLTANNYYLLLKNAYNLFHALIKSLLTRYSLNTPSTAPSHNSQTILPLYYAFYGQSLKPISKLSS